MEGSGFLAVHLCGVLVRDRAGGLVERIVSFHEGLAWLSEIVLFLMLGLLVTPHDLPAELRHATIVAVVVMLIARPLATMVCLAPLRLSWRAQIFIGWVGLHGTVPIFLAIIPVISPGPVTVDSFDVVLIVVIASLVLQGWSIPSLVGRLDLRRSRPPCRQ